MFRTPRAPPHRPSAGELWQDSRLRNLHVANEFKVRRLLEGGQDARPRRKDGPAWQPVRLRPAPRPAPPPCASALRHSTPLHGLHAPLHRLHATCPRPGPPPAPVSGLRASGGRASPSSRTRPTSRPTSWRGSTTPWVRWRVRGATRRDAPAACPGSPARPPSLCYHPLMRPPPPRAPLMADAPPPGQEYASVSQHDDD